MTEPESTDTSSTLAGVRKLASDGIFRMTVHAQKGMVTRSVSIDEVLEAIAGANILENYPEHQRGACCLLHGRTAADRHLHIVCTTEQPVLIIITAYEPQMPKWKSPTERNQ